MRRAHVKWREGSYKSSFRRRGFVVVGPEGDELRTFRVGREGEYGSYDAFAQALSAAERLAREVVEGLNAGGGRREHALRREGR